MPSKYLMIGIAGCFISLAAEAQSPLTSPVIGIASPDGLTSLSVITGVVGSSIVSVPPLTRRPAANITLAPAGRWGLISLDGTLGIVTFAGAVPGNIVPVTGGFAVPDLVSFSPKGHSAALLSRSLTAIQILTNLDTAPSVAWQADLTGLANVTTVALGDDGRFLLVLTQDSTLYLFSSGTTPQPVFGAGPASGITFLPAGNSAVVADGENGNISLLSSFDTTVTTQTVAGPLDLSAGKVFAQPSSDGSALFVLAAGGSAAYRVDLSSGKTQMLALPVPPSRLDRMRFGETFLFSAVPGQTAWLLSGDANGLTTAFAAPEHQERANLIRR